MFPNPCVDARDTETEWNDPRNWSLWGKDRLQRSFPASLLIHGWAHPVLSPQGCGTFDSWMTKAMGHLGSLLLQSSAETQRNLSHSLRASVPKRLTLFQSRSQERITQNYLLSAPTAGQSYLFSLINWMVLTHIVTSGLNLEISIIIPALCQGSEAPCGSNEAVFHRAAWAREGCRIWAEWSDRYSPPFHVWRVHAAGTV